ncbi:MAG: AAA family ATPase [Polyangiaceae bacterium]
MKTIAFFNNMGGVGKTSLVFHLAWMFRRLGLSIVALDLDPQSNLTSAFLPESRLAEMWEDEGARRTVFGSVRPSLERAGDVDAPHVEAIESDLFSPDLGLVPGDLGLASCEDRLAETWPRCLESSWSDVEDGFRVTTAFHRVARSAAEATGANLVLIDVGPSLGAINRAALVASDYIVVPLAADLFSIHGLQSLGPTLRAWRRDWAIRKNEAVVPRLGLSLPGGGMSPIGYVMLEHAVRRDLWARRVPSAYRTHVLDQPIGPQAPSTDPHLLGTIRHYRNLMPMAQQRRKPMFELTPADGAFGGHAAAVLDCREAFEKLARRIAGACGITLPS